MLDAACLCFRGAAVPAHKHPDQAEPDSHFEWITPDESSQLEFTRDRAAVLQMASEWDLCISGDGLTHLQQTGQEAAFIPLAQVLLNLCTMLLYATVLPPLLTAYVKYHTSNNVLTDKQLVDMHGSPSMHSHAHANSFRFLNVCNSFLRVTGTCDELQVMWIAGVCSSISRSEGARAANTQSGGMDDSNVRRRHKRRWSSESGTCWGGAVASFRSSDQGTEGARGAVQTAAERYREPKGSSAPRCPAAAHLQWPCHPCSHSWAACCAWSK